MCIPVFIGDDGTDLTIGGSRELDGLRVVGRSKDPVLLLIIVSVIVHSFRTVSFGVKYRSAINSPRRSSPSSSSLQLEVSVDADRLR